MSGWQPIETAPKDWTDVLVFAPEQGDRNTGGVFMGWYDPEDQKWLSYDVGGYLVLCATHWMPLPVPPVATDA